MCNTLQQPAPSDLPRREDGTIDLNGAARVLLEGCLNALMDEQASELAEATGTRRNGYRERSLDTCVGALTLRVPKLRQGTYFPEDVVARWSRTDTAMASAICDMRAAGISTRKVEKVAAEMGCASMSRSRVSRLCASLDAEVAEMRSRDLSAGPWPYLWLDATYCHCREAGAARSVGLVVAVACDGAARRRVVGLERVDTESYLSWRDFLLSLRRRGLSGVRLVVSDAHEGLARAVREVLTGAAWQRCTAHLMRNVSERCRRRGDGAAAVAALLEIARESALAYLAFPGEHARWIRTNNVMERLNAEVKRRADVVQVFPSHASLVRLAGAVCLDRDDAWLVATNFIDARSLSWPLEAPPSPQPSPEELRSALVAVEEAFERRLRAA